MNTTDTDATIYGDEKNEGMKSGKGTMKGVAAGTASGILIGALSTTLMGMAPHEADSKEEATTTHKEELSYPECVDDQVQVATGVNDDMSFGQAFAVARAEVGPGGVFEWHGNLYGTYTAEEWNGMTAEQKAEYGDHFSWNHIDASSSSFAQHSATYHNNHISQTTDDIEVVSVDHSSDVQAQQVSDVEADASDMEIEVLGVVHDNETGANIGGIAVDGQEAILIDVDDDLVFDYMASDLNQNNQLDEGEVVDIHNQGITVPDLLNNMDPNEMLASDDGPDYSNDATYEI